MIFEKEYNRLANIINDFMKYTLEQMEPYPEIIFKSIEHSLYAGGKRLRPVMLLAAHEMVGGDINESLPLACGLEMIHTYSLIHDDLPAMDDDDLRRGIPTNHKVFGEGIAILAGDGLLNLAYEVMLQKALLHPKKLQLYVEAIHIIANAAGIKGMIGGQVVDLQNQGKVPDPKILEYIHGHKTGALFSAALMAGVILENPPLEIKNHIRQYGESLGLAFQIMDDILDVIGDDKKLGKAVGRDEKSQKATYVQQYGMEKSRVIAQNLVEQAVQATELFGDNGLFLRKLAYYIINRQN